MQVLIEIMVQIKQKRGIEVENPSPRSFSGGNDEYLHQVTTVHTVYSLANSLVQGGEDP